MAIRLQVIGASLLALACVIAVPAVAVPYDVYAKENSSSGGSGLDTVTLSVGQSFSVSVNPSDIWSAGAGLRWSNANGLIGPLIATAGDGSGFPPGTPIGQFFPNWTQSGLSAPYGSLIGAIGSGPFFLIGTSYSGTAALSGVLRLFYWDENSADNLEHITAEVTAAVGETPLPAALPLFVTGIAGLGFLTYRRKRKQAS